MKIAIAIQYADEKWLLFRTVYFIRIISVCTSDLMSQCPMVIEAKQELLIPYQMLEWPCSRFTAIFKNRNKNCDFVRFKLI